MHRLIGIETEYGIAVEGRGAHDLIAEAAEVVRAYRGPHYEGWNYAPEAPRRDFRGFTVDQLSIDPNDAKFDQGGAPSAYGAGARSDRVLANGARLYNDHGHPEYATPECSNLRDLVAHDRAGERIVLDCARRRQSESGRSIHIYKNNTDFHGASYGTHECYLMQRGPHPERVISALAPFLATRQLLVGAGKVGLEMDRAKGVTYQLSQRADFMSVLASVDTLHNRPLVNTRDEPHATPADWRRLHVICGDANLSEWATAMKAGITSLILGLIEQDAAPRISLKSPVAACKSISRDRSLKWLVEQEDGTLIGALDVQRRYLHAAMESYCGESDEGDWVLGEWRRALDDLESDITLCANRIDWVAKLMLLEQFMDAEDVDWGDPILQSLDLAYHNVDPNEGLYLGLEQSGCMMRIVDEAAIAQAICSPPADTRAFIRGLFVSRFEPSVTNLSWNSIEFTFNGELYQFDMNPLVDAGVNLLNQELAQVTTLPQLASILERTKDLEGTV